MTGRSPSPPTPLARRYVRYILGFAVGVAVGLAPFLGVLEVPLFTPLLSLFPETLKAITVPFSSFVMGLVAVGVQFAAGEEVSRRWLRWCFAGTFLAILVGVVVLLNLYTETVLTVPGVATAEGRKINMRLVVGGPRPVPVIPGCRCEPAQTDVACIEEIGFENPRVCWGQRQVDRAERSLTLAYLFLTGSFGALIGLLLLQEESRRKEASKRGDRRPQRSRKRRGG